MNLDFMEETESKTFKLFDGDGKLTLLKAIGDIASAAENSSLSDQFFEKVKPQTDYLSKRLGMTPIQTVLFSAIMEEGSGMRIGQLSNWLGCMHVSLLAHKGELDKLVKRHYLRYDTEVMRYGYSVPDDVTEALQANKAYRHRHYRGLTTTQFLTQVDGNFFKLDNNDMPYSMALENIMELMRDNAKLDIVTRIRTQFHDHAQQMQLLFFCTEAALHASTDIEFHEMQFLFPSYIDYSKFRMSMEQDTHEFITSGLLEHTNDGGFRQLDHFKMTEKAERELLSDAALKVSLRKENDMAGLVLPGTIEEKAMFYPKEVERQVETVSSLLREDNYKRVHERLVSRGMRSGFACLFYGAPGTGKTETVRQIARLTGRAIMQVDIASIRDKYVGESEKQIQKVFDRYRKLVRTSELTPILLFNECDAILGRRPQNGGSTGVEKMEQSMQNIILQEMERLDGIMICTTNLATSLDAAFERRFLYKVEFTEPTKEARQSIWQSMIPGLSRGDALTLAENYRMSGGNIENIARKANVDAVLWGDDAITLQRLEGYCDEERIEKHKGPKIGF